MADTQSIPVSPQTAPLTDVRRSLLDLAAAVNPDLIRHMQAQLRHSVVYFDPISRPPRSGHIGTKRDLGLCVTLNSDTSEITAKFCVMTPQRDLVHCLHFISTSANAITLSGDGLLFTKRDRNAIAEYGFLAVRAVFLPDDSPDAAVHLLTDLPLDQFMGYEVPEKVVRPDLMEAMEKFAATSWDPTTTITFNATMYMHSGPHVTCCYVQQVMVEPNITDPVEFAVWYFQNGKSVEIVEEKAPTGKHWEPTRAGFPRHYLTDNTGVYLVDDQ